MTALKNQRTFFSSCVLQPYLKIPQLLYQVPIDRTLATLKDEGLSQPYACHLSFLTFIDLLFETQSCLFFSYDYIY